MRTFDAGGEGGGGEGAEEAYVIVIPTTASAVRGSTSVTERPPSRLLNIIGRPPELSQLLSMMGRALARLLSAIGRPLAAEA